MSYTFFSRAEAGYYYPTLLQHQYEIEDGQTEDNAILRFGFNQTKFPSFSMKGYGEFSVVQVCLQSFD